jgi:xanthosine utilization system XapX-like protein
MSYSQRNEDPSLYGGNGWNEVMERISQTIAKAVKLGVLAAPLVSLAGIFILSAGTDETWILFGVRGLVENGRFGVGEPFRGVHSTAGVYTALTALLHVLGHGRLEVVRLVALLGLVGVLVALHRWSLHLGLPKRAAWVVTAAPLALPGTFMLGSQAYGTLLAFLLLLLGLACWGELPAGSWRRRLWAGVLLGAAGATRFECAFAFGAPAVASLLTRDKRRAQLIESLIVLGIAAVVFALLTGALLALSGDVKSGQEVGATGAMGRPGPLAYLVPLRLNHWAVTQGFLPLCVAALASIGWLTARPRVASPRSVDALLVFGWFAWFAFIMKAPNPHLRYAWPSLASFMCVGTLALATLLRDDPPAAPRLALLGLAFLFAGYMDGARTLLEGESDILSWQWAGEARQSVQYGPLHARHNQRAMAARLAALPADAGVGTIGFDTALAFLSRRPVVPVISFYPSTAKTSESGGVTFVPADPATRPRYLVVVPFVNRFPGGQMGAPLHDWMEVNTELVAREGPYLLYRVVGQMPPTPDIFMLDPWEPRLPHLPPPS